MPVKLHSLGRLVKLFHQLPAYWKLRDKKWAGLRVAYSSPDAVRCLRGLFPHRDDITADCVQAHFDELAGYTPLRDSVNSYPAIFESGFTPLIHGQMYADVLFCFIALRLMQPEVVVETGCLTGWDSSLILLALHLNQKGHLYSVDLPMDQVRHHHKTVPAPLQNGFVVPDSLRERWTLCLGDTKTELMPLLKKVQTVDVFFHDSLHTYDHMMWEFTAVWTHLSDRAILICDDIAWNTSFGDFAEAMDTPIILHASNYNFGVLTRGASWDKGVVQDIGRKLYEENPY